MRKAAVILALFLMTAAAASDRPNRFKVMRYTPDGSMEVVLQSYGPPRAKAATPHDKRCHGAQIIRAPRH
jgi:hypothetical protein